MNRLRARPILESFEKWLRDILIRFDKQRGPTTKFDLQRGPTIEFDLQRGPTRTFEGGAYVISFVIIISRLLVKASSLHFLEGNYKFSFKFFKTFYRLKTNLSKSQETVIEYFD